MESVNLSQKLRTMAINPNLKEQAFVVYIPEHRPALNVSDTNFVRSLAIGKPLKEIAKDKRVSLSKARNQQFKIFEKLGVKNACECVYYCVKNKIIN